jgi:ssDNA-binding Zn-finger/Zn-ribbon topoisomerase 1
MILRNSRFGKFYGCSKFPLCEATHGAHPDGKPLGFPANKELKLLRIRAHKKLEEQFGKWDTMTKQKKGEMYKWLAGNTRSGHIAQMNEKDIEELLRKLNLQTP